jgi:uncharacterized protein (DUF1015 family)
LVLALSAVTISIFARALEARSSIMAEIFPFHAYRYNADHVKLADVLTQPYDKISPAMQERYARSSPYNLITIEKGQAHSADTATDNVYTRAAQALKDWINKGIVVRDPSPGIYIYSQEFTAPGGSQRRTRRGFIGLGKLEEYEAGVVFRHEKTLSGPKADRLELLRHTRTHTGQLFMLYADPQRRTDALLDQGSTAAAPVEMRDEYHVMHRLWPVFDSAIIAGISAAMAEQKLVIADGHHRYETALAYRNERRANEQRISPDAPFEKVMMTFFNSAAEDLLILPGHRVIADLSSFDAAEFRKKIAPLFESAVYSLGNGTERSTTLEKFRRDLVARGPGGHSIGMFAGREFVLLRLRPEVNLASVLPDVPPAVRELDLVLLHRLLLEDGLGITPAAVVAGKHVTYEREMDAALAAVDQGKAQVAFLINAVSTQQVMEIALSGEVLPQKSTDFYPKLMSGITMYRME